MASRVPVAEASEEIVLSPPHAPVDADPMEADLELEGGEGAGDAEEVGPAARTGLVWAIPGVEQWVLHEGKEVELGALELDLAATKGQILPLSEAMVRQRVASLETNMPVVPLRVLLWQENPARETYVVLGGQHSAKAAMVLRGRMLLSGVVPPPALCTVVGRVLKAGTPLSVRRRLAGDHQQEQGAVVPVPLSRLVRFVAEHLAGHPGDRVGALVAGIHQSGWPVRYPTWGEAHKALGHVLKVVEALGPEAEAGVAALERNESVSARTFRCLRGCRTPDSLLAALTALREDRPTRSRLEASARAAIHDMWVSFHWRVENPKIDGAKGEHREHGLHLQK